MRLIQEAHISLMTRGELYTTTFWQLDVVLEQRHCVLCSEKLLRTDVSIKHSVQLFAGRRLSFRGSTKSRLCTASKAHASDLLDLKIPGERSLVPRSLLKGRSLHGWIAMWRWGSSPASPSIPGLLFYIAHSGAVVTSQIAWNGRRLQGDKGLFHLGRGTR